MASSYKESRFLSIHGFWTQKDPETKNLLTKKAEGFGRKTFSFVLSFDKTNKNDYFELKKVVLHIFWHIAENLKLSEKFKKILFYTFLDQKRPIVVHL